jgi:hypothetical protein
MLVGAMLLQRRLTILQQQEQATHMLSKSDLVSVSYASMGRQKMVMSLPTHSNAILCVSNTVALSSHDAYVNYAEQE